MQMTQGNKELNGLGGWLILVGIGVLVAPFKTGAVLINTFSPDFFSWNVGYINRSNQ